MVKAVKVVLLALAPVFLLLVGGVVALTLPGVQQFLIARLVASEPDESLEADHLHIGFGRTEAREVRFVKGDARYGVEKLTADLSLTALIFGGELRLGDVNATGLVIDLSSSGSEDPDGDESEDDGAEPFEGLLRALDLPMPLSLDSLRAEGTILFPADGETDGMAAGFVVTGEKIAPDSVGRLAFSGELERDSTVAESDRLRVDGNVEVHQGGGGRLDRARLLAEVSWSGARTKTDRLQADVLLLATDRGETYRAHFGRLGAAGSTSPRTDPSTLVTLDAGLSREAGVLEGAWNVDIDREQLAAFVGDLELPVFAAAGSGTFAYGGEGERLDLAGELALRVDDLAWLAAELEELGGVALNSRFDLTVDAKRVRLEECVVALNDAEGETLLEARNFQSLRYDRETERLEGSDARTNLAEVTIRGLPVEWINLFSGDDDGQGVRVRGGNLTGRLLVGSASGAPFLNLVEPVRVDGLSLFSGDRIRLADLSVEALGAATFRDGALTGRLEDLVVYREETWLLAGSADFDTAARRVGAHVRADLPRLLSQPVLADVATLSAGLLELEATLRYGDGLEVELEGMASNLASPASEGESLPTVGLRASARRTGEESWTIEVPLRVEGRGSSDLRVAGTLRPEEERTRFALTVSGERVELDEMLALSSLFGGEEAPSEPGRPTDGNASAKTDDEAIWAGLDGTVAVDIGEILVRSEYAIRDLVGELAVRAESVAASLEANLLESPVALETGVTFLSGAEAPYVLSGTLDAPELAAAELFRRLQPDRPPTLEGLFALSVELHGAGKTLGEMLERVRGRAHLQSGGGIIRLLYSDNPLAGIGSAAGALIGTFVHEVGAVTRIADRFSNLSYADLDILAGRDENLNFVLDELTVLSPEIHLRGTGSISHREDVALLEQPMDLTIRLGAKGELERMLAEIRVLGRETDERNYRYMRRDFVIRGTPADPDARVFYRILLDTVLQFVGPGDRGNEEERPSLVPRIPEVFDGLLRGIREGPF